MDHGAYICKSTVIAPVPVPSMTPDPTGSRSAYLTNTSAKVCHKHFRQHIQTTDTLPLQLGSLDATSADSGAHIFC